MHCNEINKQLDDYLDGELDSAAQRLFDAHIESCGACHDIVERAKLVQSMLGQFARATAPKPIDGFYAQALGAAQQPTQASRRGLRMMTGFGGAIAAAVMMWIVAGVVLEGPGVGTPHLPEVTMALETPQTFNLVFSSAAALDGATMTVTLPAGIELDGFTGQREITWMTSLREGRNMLPLRLVATTPTGGELLATLRHGDDDKMFRLQVSVI